MLLYVHRNHRLIRDGSPGRPTRLSHSSLALIYWFSTSLRKFIQVGPKPRVVKSDIFSNNDDDAIRCVGRSCKAHLLVTEFQSKHFNTQKVFDSSKCWTPTRHNQKRINSLDFIFDRQSSGAVWESRWPSWAFRPNEPSGFCGRKAILNRAPALVSACS